MASEAKHTPLPWRLHDMERATIVAGKPGGEVANCANGFGDRQANAELIITAVNAYPTLLAERDAALVAVEGMRKALEETVGRIMNAEIDLSTGQTKATVAGRLRDIAADLRKALSTPEQASLPSEVKS